MTEPKIMIVGETEQANRTQEILKDRKLNPVVVGAMGLAETEGARYLFKLPRR